MKTVTVRLDEETVDELDVEAESDLVGPNIRNRTDYLRMIIRNRQSVLDEIADDEDGDGGSMTPVVERRFEELADRLDTLDARVDGLAAQAHNHSWDSDADSSP